MVRGLILEGEGDGPRGGGGPDDDDPPPETPRTPTAPHVPLGTPRRARPLATVSLEELAGVVAAADSLLTKLSDQVTSERAELALEREANRRELASYRTDVQACTAALQATTVVVRETFEGWKAHAKRSEEANAARFAKLEDEIGHPAPDDEAKEGRGIRGTLSVLVRDLRARREGRLASGVSRGAVGVVSGGGGAFIYKLLESVLS